MSAPNDYLQISQLAVYDTYGNNIALQGNASASSIWTGSLGSATCVVSAASVIDGNLIGKDFNKCSADTYGVYHSGYSNGDWWLLDLGATYDISRIVYYNRADNGLGYRARGCVIQGLDAQKNIVNSVTLTSIAVRQQYQSLTNTVTDIPGNTYLYGLVIINLL